VRTSNAPFSSRPLRRIRCDGRLGGLIQQLRRPIGAIEAYSVVSSTAGLRVSVTSARLLSLFVAIRLFKELDDLSAGHELCAVDSSRGYVVGGARLMQSSLTADCKLDLSFENGSPLPLMTVRRELNVLQDLKEDQLPLVRLKEAGSNRG